MNRLLFSLRNAQALAEALHDEAQDDQRLELHYISGALLQAVQFVEGRVLPDDHLEHIRLQAHAAEMRRRGSARQAAERGDG